MRPQAASVTHTNAFMARLLVVAFFFLAPINAQAQLVKTYPPQNKISLPPELSVYLAKKRRANSIALNMFRANADSCPLLLPEFQAQTHQLSDYPHRSRGAAAHILNAKKKATILKIENPLTNPLKAGDILLNGNNKPAFETHGDVLNYRQVGFVKVQRDEEVLVITQSGPPICPYAVKLKLKNRIQAKAKGVHIYLSMGLIDFVENDHELAFVIGHELAHLTQGDSNSGTFGRARDKSIEFEADRTGLKYAIKAGYDPVLAIEFWHRWAKAHEGLPLDKKRRERLKRYQALNEYIETL